VFGQIAKGFIWFGLSIIALFLPLIGTIIVCVAAVADSYKVGKKLQAGKPVGKMEWFPG
jgi:hypothetical protein